MYTYKYTYHIFCRISKEKILKGYHGTKPQNAKDILNNNSVVVTPFKITTDFVIPSGQRLPNDLGQGLYLFLDSDKPKFDGKQCAKLYAHRWRNEDNKVSLILFDIDESDIFSLDLNKQENAEKFIEIRNKLVQRVEQRLTTFKEGKILDRANIDGIFIEYLVQHFLENKVDLIIKDTYTPFYSSRNTLSNFSNGRELCLRNMGLINWEETKEVK